MKTKTFIPKSKFLLVLLLIVVFAGVSSLSVISCIDDETIDTKIVTSVNLNSSSLSLTVGSTATLTATILPTTSTDVTVVWTTSSSAVATVSGGVVTAVAAGTATITATAGDKSATCTVTVKEAETTASKYSQTSGTNTASSKAYTSSSSDENAVYVGGGSFTMTNCTVTKPSGNTTNSDGSSFYGTNAAVLATNGGTVTMDGGTITTSATGANAVVAYGGTANISNVTMTCTSNLSRGIHATGGGTIVASNNTITTSGNNSSVIATDRGGGTVTVTGGTYTTTGGDCAVIYSTGTITATNITGSSSQGEIGVIEGSNVININNSKISSGSSSRGMMILQSGSGDASGYNGKINVTNGTLTLTGSSTPLIEICTSVTGTVTLTDVALTIPSGILMKVDYNTRWSTTNPVAYLVLSTASSANYTGSVTVDSYGTSTVTVNKSVTWSGAYDNANTGKSTTVVVNGTWNLTGNSYVDKVIVGSGGVINKNGYTLTYSSLSNSGTIN